MTKTELELPYEMTLLPKDEAGRPIPWFVPRIKGKPDYRLADQRKFMPALKNGLCWICGREIEGIRCFVVGPMAALNSIAAEPPSHQPCAEYAVQACPFLSNPNKGRREGLPEGSGKQADMLEYNPGVSLLWECWDFAVHETSTGLLFEMGQPRFLSWWKEGRKATREEVVAAVHHSRDEARKLVFAKHGANGVLDLARAYKFAMDHMIPKSILEPGAPAGGPSSIRVV